MRTAEIVIIGGGIVGSSIAYHLTAAGCKGVLVVERESSQGKGSTGKSMGGVRALCDSSQPSAFRIRKPGLPLLLND
jgi:glycine/D-amino acid oxidase-like deaminating enzyme